MDSSKKNYVRIDTNTSTEEIFALLDNVNSDDEDNIDEVLNDSDTEFYVEEGSYEMEGSSKKQEEHNLLTPEANVHVLPNSNKEQSTKKQQMGKKKGSNTDQAVISWKNKGTPIRREPCTLDAQVKHEFPEHFTPYDVYEKVVQLDILVEMLVSETNIYAQQSGRNFCTDSEEMKAFLGVNFVMAINQLPTLSHYWDGYNTIGNIGIQNVFTRSRFQTILQNLHFANNDTSDYTDKAYKVRPLIKHFNCAFMDAFSDDSNQSIDEHMTKFKGRSSMKQYLQLKPIKWGFKWWFRCASSSGYLYEFDIYLGKKKDIEVNLGEGVVLQLTEKLERSYCTVYFDNFFNSPMLINKLFDKGIYAVGTVRSNRKQMPLMKSDKQMKRGDVEFKYSENVLCCKWYDNKAVLLLGSNIEGMDTCSSIQRRMKGSASKASVNCPSLVKFYNKNMGGVDLMDQKTAAYRLDRRSKCRFYLRIFFDLMDVALVNSHIVYQHLKGNLDLLDFKIAVANSLIGKYSNRQRAVPQSRPSKRKSVNQAGPTQTPDHLPEFQVTRQRCMYCKTDGKDIKTFAKCETCGVHLCLLKERNCFLKYHTQV